MKTYLVLSLVLATVSISEVPTAWAVPGSPLSGGNFGAVDISDGINVLPGPVEAGDVVLRENPALSFDRANWSDVVRFFNLNYQGVNFGLAFQISDSEAGIPNITVLGNEDTNILLTDTLSANAQFLTEIQVGTGTDPDITPYFPTAGTAYNIHSDAAISPDVPDVVIQVGAQINPGKGNRIITIDEGGSDFRQLRVGGVYNPGVMIDPNDGGDTLAIAPDPADPNGHTIITLVSFADDNDSPIEIERMNARGDEITTGYLITSYDVPEPSVWLLVSTGLIAFVGKQRIRKRSRYGDLH
jgi:hypothetical protein